MEIRGNSEAASSVKPFSEKLAELQLDSSKNVTVHAKEVAVLNLIKTYPVPNTVEDLAEFMIFAANNIDYSAFKSSFINTINVFNHDFDLQEKIATSKAWIAKMEQMYNKAKLSFPDSPKFQQIKEIYEDAKKQEKKSKSGSGSLRSCRTR